MPVRAALDDAAQPAGLAVEVEAQRQRMQMAEHFEGEVADRPLRHRREQRVADLAQRLRQHAGRAIGQDEDDRHGDGLRRGLAQRIDRLLVEDRDVDVDELGQDQQPERHHDADAQGEFTLWP